MRFLLITVAVPLIAADCPERAQPYTEVACSGAVAVHLALPAGVKQITALATKEKTTIRIVTAASVPVRCFQPAAPEPAAGQQAPVLQIQTCLSTRAYTPVLVRREKEKEREMLFVEPRP